MAPYGYGAWGIEPGDLYQTDVTLVLDMDECLVHSFEGQNKAYTDLKLDSAEHMSLRPRLYKVEVGDIRTRGAGGSSIMWGIRRPYLTEFLRKARRRHRKLVIWSAGVKTYVNAVVAEMFKDVDPPDLVVAKEDYYKEAGCDCKPLTWLSSRYPELGPLNKILMVDDIKENFSQNPDNGIVIPAYRPDLTVGSLYENDVALLQLDKWLSQDHVLTSHNVRHLNKQGIFRYY